MRSAPRRKPTAEQTRALMLIAQSPLVKTFVSDKSGKPKTIWGLANGREITADTAETLIRNGWVVPQRDGLDMFDETQTYTARTP